MKIFVLGVPHTQTSLEYTTCAFTMNAWNLCSMLTRRGHEVIHLGVEGSCPECTEHVSLVSEAYWWSFYDKPGTEYYNTKAEGEFKPYHDLYGERLREAILTRTSDPWSAIICAPWGEVQNHATQGLPQFVVESGIGYRHTWAKYRVFESYNWLHFHWGLEQRHQGANWYDVVIPSPLNTELFEFRPHDKRDHFLFFGRLNEDKGVRIAIDVAKKVGRKIIICGQGNPDPYLEGNGHVIYHPPVAADGRRKLLAEAAAFFCPTIYVEPFGKVACEAQASGTPVICTDWGAFPETVLHGYTGYRCRTMEQFVWAAKNFHRIDPATCRRWAIENFGLERVALMYEEYFQSLLNLGLKGWDEDNEIRTELDWLKRFYPRTCET